MSWSLTPNNLKHLGSGLLAVAIFLPVVVLVLDSPLGEPTSELAESFPGVSFKMGSPKSEEGRFTNETLHSVTLTRTFFLEEVEVTQGDFERLLGSNPMREREGCREAGLGPDLPIVCVTWEDAILYCNARSEDEGLPSAYRKEGDQWEWDKSSGGYRLPTEAEWEYAARAGSSTPWVGTDDPADVCLYSNVADASFKREFGERVGDSFECDDRFPYLAPVRALGPNEWGFYGMGGNAAEWVWAGYGGDFQEGEVVDPEGSLDASDRVFRGGSWRGGPRVARAAYRGWGPPSGRSGSLGFRVARSVPLALVPLRPERQPGPLEEGPASGAAGAAEAVPGVASRPSALQ